MCVSGKMRHCWAPRSCAPNPRQIFKISRRMFLFLLSRAGLALRDTRVFDSEPPSAGVVVEEVSAAASPSERNARRTSPLGCLWDACHATGEGGCTEGRQRVVIVGGGFAAVHMCEAGEAAPTLNHHDLPQRPPGHHWASPRAIARPRPPTATSSAQDLRAEQVRGEHGDAHPRHVAWVTETRGDRDELRRNTSTTSSSSAPAPPTPRAARPSGSSPTTPA